MRCEVRRTGWVDWQFGASGSGMELVVAPVLVLANLLVWLAHRARGRGWTLHVDDGPGGRHTRDRFRTRAEAEAALAALRGSTHEPPAETAHSARSRRPRTAGDGVAAPAPSPGDLDGPFRRGPSSRGPSPTARGDR